jgi:hypothetical protein
LMTVTFLEHVLNVIIIIGRLLSLLWRLSFAKTKIFNNKRG